MKWQIKQVGLDRSTSLEERARRKIIAPLSRMAGQTARVMVRLKSGDGRTDAGGHGASVLVSLRNGPVLNVDAWSVCHHSALDDAADRVRHAVSRYTDRRQGKRRREATSRRRR